jgi:hypothetical protein
MLADVEVNATVYVQPTTGSGVKWLSLQRFNDDPIRCICQQHTVAKWRTTRLHTCRCCSARVFALFRRAAGESSHSELDQRGDHRASEMGTAVRREHVANSLLELMQAHGFACEIRDQVACRSRRWAEAQVTQQVEQLFEHLTPHAAIESDGHTASSLPRRL